MFGMGTENATVQYDELGPPPEAPGGDKKDVLKYVDTLIGTRR
jgi:hypothetical protein